MKPFEAAVLMTEDMLQVYSADVIRAFKADGVIAYHVPNGGKRHIAVARKLKKFGTLPGVADWAFVLPDGRAAFIELKDATGKQNDAQIKFQRACGYIDVPYAIARTPEQFDAAAIQLGIINKPASQPEPVVRGGERRAAGAASVSRRRPRNLSGALAAIVIVLCSIAHARAENGIASVYCCERTANGEYARASGLMAAHRTLPLGTRVRVTNTRTGRSITVRINDRGPYVRGRVIDLTPAAAHAIGVNGLGFVSVEPRP